MDSTDVELFLTIVDASSITRAAELLNFSQSTVSYRVKLLEKELGVQLFHRSRGNRAIELTLQGEHFIPIARRWLSVYRDTQTLKFIPENVLTVATVDSVNSSILPHVYRAVSQAENPLRLKIITGHSPQVYDLVENRTADIGFISIPCQRKNVVTTMSFTQKFYVVRYCDSPSPPKKISPENLDPRFEIYQNWGGEYPQWHESVWGPLTTYYAWIDTVALLQCFLTAPCFWSILPDTSLAQLMSNFQRIQVYELDMEHEYVRTCYGIKNKEPRKSCLNSMKIFDDALHKRLQELNRG